MFLVKQNHQLPQKIAGELGARGAKAHHSAQVRWLDQARAGSRWDAERCGKAIGETVKPFGKDLEIHGSSIYFFSVKLFTIGWIVKWSFLPLYSKSVLKSGCFFFGLCALCLVHRSSAPRVPLFGIQPFLFGWDDTTWYYYIRVSSLYVAGTCGYLFSILLSCWSMLVISTFFQKSKSLAMWSPKNKLSPVLSMKLGIPLLFGTIFNIPLTPSLFLVSHFPWLPSGYLT